MNGPSIALDNFSIITEIIRFSAKFQHHSKRDVFVD